MPQLTDAVTGQPVLNEAPRADPLAAQAYRSSVVAADGTAKPAPGAGTFSTNPGYRATCRVFVETSGGPTSCTVRPYVRSGGTAGHVAAGPALTLNGSPNFDLAFDVSVNGDDIAVLVETLGGGSSPAVSIYLSWR